VRHQASESGWSVLSITHTVLLEEPEALDADMIQEDGATAKAEAERPRPGLAMFTEGSWLASGAAGYSVTWQNGQRWVGIKTHMGYNQEAYDMECAASQGHWKLRQGGRRPRRGSRSSRVRRPPSSARPRKNPGQMYAIQAREHIAALQRARSGIIIDPMVPSPQGSPRRREG
jgi:hypothetical protein